MIHVGLRELRQDASDLVRRVEAGEEVTVTVAGRPAARLVPVAPRRWRSHAEVADLFPGPPDVEWLADRERIDGALGDPWTPAREPCSTPASSSPRTCRRWRGSSR